MKELGVEASGMVKLGAELGEGGARQSQAGERLRASVERKHRFGVVERLGNWAKWSHWIVPSGSPKEK